LQSVIIHSANGGMGEGCLGEEYSVALSVSNGFGNWWRQGNRNLQTRNTIETYIVPAKVHVRSTYVKSGSARN
jgi:hypothetical protein